MRRGKIVQGPNAVTRMYDIEPTSEDMESIVLVHEDNIELQRVCRLDQRIGVITLPADEKEEPTLRCIVPFSWFAKQRERWSQVGHMHIMHRTSASPKRPFWLDDYCVFISSELSMQSVEETNWIEVYQLHFNATADVECRRPNRFVPRLFDTIYVTKAHCNVYTGDYLLQTMYPHELDHVLDFFKNTALRSTL